MLEFTGLFNRSSVFLYFICKDNEVSSTWPLKLFNFCVTTMLKNQEIIENMWIRLTEFFLLVQLFRMDTSSTFLAEHCISGTRHTDWFTIGWTDNVETRVSRPFVDGTFGEFAEYVTGAGGREWFRRTSGGWGRWHIFHCDF